MIMTNVRQAIFDRLHRHHRQPCDSAQDNVAIRPDKESEFDRDEAVKRFVTRMQAVQAEVYSASPETWLKVLQTICQAKGVNNLMVSNVTEHGKTIHANAALFPPLECYQQPIETWKTRLFESIDAAVTESVGAVADTGTLILCPDSDEPRTLSLVPPIHIAILEKHRIYATLAEAIHAQHWTNDGMPTNVILISGPSKSADIEQTMTYGVHGPKQLIVLIV